MQRMFEGPLHSLCEEGKWAELKQLLLSVFHPGDHASEDHKDWNIARLKTALLTQEGPNQWTPLMIACVRAPIDVITLIVNAQPRACLIPDKSGSLPVHFCSTFRRGAFVEVLLKVLCEAAPSSLEVQNAWRQTPLHSLLDAKQLAPIGCLRVLLDQGQCTDQALQLRDRNFRMPIHVASHKFLPPEFLQALVEASRESCYETDRTGSLPCQILHVATQGRAHVESMEALLIPLALGTRTKRRSTMGTAKPTTWSQLATLTKQAAQLHDAQSIAPPQTRTAAQDACRVNGMVRMLPLHLAAEYGVKLEILKGICRQYPAAAKLGISWKGLPANPVPTTTSEQTAQNGMHRTIIRKHPSTITEEDEDDFTTDGDDDYLTSEEDDGEVPDESAASQLVDSNLNSTATQAEVDTVDVLPANQAEDDDPWEEESLNTPESEEDDFDFEDVEEDNDPDTDEAPPTEDYETQLAPQNPTLCALEIFERGRAAQQVKAAIRMHAASEIDEVKLDDCLTYYTLRSDLLLAYNIELVNGATGKKFFDDPVRLGRLESHILSDARDNALLTLSDTTAVVWIYLAMYSEDDSPRKYIHSVGRILSSLGPSGLWKLTVVPSPLEDSDKFVRISATGRMVVQEADLRAPSARMDHLLKNYWFQHLLTTYFEPADALNYSMCSRYTRAGGVRLLPQIPLRVTEAAWQKAPTAISNTPSKPWQRLDVLVTPDCTHTVFVTFYVEYTYPEDASTDDRQADRSLGGMLVVRDDDRKLRPNVEAPWGKAVVAYRETPPISGSLVRLSFQHVPGRSYGLWHYNKGGPGTSLSVSDVRVRQLLHSCDSRGRSPLHLLLSTMVDQPSNQKLNMQVSMLLAAKFGSGDSVGDVPLHYALKCGVSEEVLTSIIMASPASLVDTDKEGRTPIHAAFLLSKDEPPPIGVVRALLTAPGDNAIKLKDSSGRLPIHIATERGAGEAILRMLVEAYPDGCYRANRNGDLPLHLLLKSGTATTTTVELLIRPMMQNETICKIGGSRGVNLPLHVAAEYQCSFNILAKLLQTHGDAALVARQRIKDNRNDGSSSDYALDIFENGREVAEIDDVEDEGVTLRAKQDVKSADFALRSDLIFVYNPLLRATKTMKAYRSDRERIRRLENMIRREASQCGEDRKINRRARLSDMARQGWIFLCTYHNPDDASDNFAGTVRRILRGLSANAVDVLAHAENPKSIPTPNLLIKDCATPVCQLLIMSRLRFVGRYVLYDEMHPVHKSDSCLVMRAKDHGLEDEYKRFMAICDAKEQEVEDDISDAGSDPPDVSSVNGPNEVTVEMFVNFATKMGISAGSAREEILHLLALDRKRGQPDNTSNPTAAGPDTIVTRANDDDSFGADEDMSLVDLKKKDPDDENALSVGKEAFTTFCRAHRVNEKGVRTVVIKFMKSSSQFKREIDVRTSLDLSGTKWPVVPILDHYNVDRIEASRRKDIDTMSLRDEMAEDAISGAPENRDELYALDILEKNASVHNFALYKYAVVMPAGDRDLGEISQHEELGVLQIREYMLQIGNALQRLHEQNTIHGDLKMDNVVRFGKNIALVDLDGAYKYGDSLLDEKFGGASSKFSTGILPPEMVTRIDLVADFPKLFKYEDYWRRVSEDAKDVKLLTPDDIQTITAVTKSLLAKADVARNLRKTRRRGLRDELKAIDDGLENRNDWKDILSISLMTISFEDLPYSLNRCEEVDEFSNVWNRLLFHAQLWNKVKPRITADERYAYLIKTYNDIPDKTGLMDNPDISKVPYALVDPSVKIDVWSFGVLLYALCSGGTLFHLGFDGDLHDSEDFVDLYEWNKMKAERIIREKVEDPLAQDLLLQILIPEDSRLPTMGAVLEHPFFGPSSSLDAQHILERHEEEQLIVEETVVIKRMTTDTRRKIERAMERLCKIIYDEDKIVVPTCLIVVPYKLDTDGTDLIAKSETAQGLAIELGGYLLDISKTTAMLSFYLMLKQAYCAGKGQASSFGKQLKAWTRRLRNESMERIVSEILQEIRCGKGYAALCEEMLTNGEAQAVKFITDPLTAASQLIAASTDSLVQCYQTTQNLYLIDEMNGVPVRSEDADMDDFNELVYPIAVDRNSDTLRTLLLPFIHIAVMKLTAAEGLEALAKMLGLPRSLGVPKGWDKGRASLVHSADKPSTIAEFAVLHEVMRRQGMENGGGGLAQKDANPSIDEMRNLEDFFRDFDPVRTFADLHRVSDGKDGSSAIWTTESEVNRIQCELELASAEFKLRELKKEWVKRQKMQEEIQELTAQVERLQGKPPRRIRSHVTVKTGNQAMSPSSDRLKSQSSSRLAKGPSDSSMSQNGRRTPSSGAAIVDPESAANEHRARRKKMRVRPYFGVC